MRCPKCKSTALVKDGKTAIGTQRYICKFCGTRSAGERTIIKFKNIESIKCEKCGSTNIKKKGYTKAGTQIYFCRDCNRKFVPIEKTRYLKKQEKELIIKYHFCLGISIPDLAKHLNRSTRTLYNFINKYKLKNEERRTGNGTN